MTSLNPDPMMVSAGFQIATTLPMFLLTLPAGALADIVDGPRAGSCSGAQLAVAAISIAFAALVSLRLATPGALLATTFALGATSALAAPAWLLVTPMLVSKDDLDSAVAINNASFNVSRAIGPAVGGFTIAAFGIRISLLVLFSRQRRACRRCALVGRSAQDPGDAAGRGSPARCGPGCATCSTTARWTRRSSARSRSFCSRAHIWPFFRSLRVQLHNGPAIYGVLLGMIGLGSIVGSFGLDSAEGAPRSDVSGPGQPWHDCGARHVRSGERASLGDGQAFWRGRAGSS